MLALYPQALRVGLGDALKAVVLFGSVAREGTTPDSDIDPAPAGPLRMGAGR